ncbi:MAG: hydroxypyruvate isomerase [Verrucomicrobia bacterium]|nr:MAG: hydroxypyruvate isomerase [Verrucomicrobiota bacterium]
MNTPMSRRSAITKVAAGAALTAIAPKLRAADEPTPAPAKLKGRINHSACRWCYGKIPLDDLCKAGKEMGLVAIDLLDPKDFETVKKHGLVCSMVSFPTIDGLGGIGKAWNRVEHHDKLVQAYEERLKQTADAGFERLICFSGNRAGLDDQKGLENCELGLKRILPLAEKLKITVCMELLNSKRSHKDYQCDHTAWGVELVKRISSERFKLLYDIFHMQIMDGDVCDTIRENHQYFDHYHTGGVPGRNEIDDSQELNYPRIMKAILDTGFKGYVAQEFVPKRPDALASLKQGVQICDV